jgi:hypothetical protein
MVSICAHDRHAGHPDTAVDLPYFLRIKPGGLGEPVLATHHCRSLTPDTAPMARAMLSVSRAALYPVPTGPSTTLTFANTNSAKHRDGSGKMAVLPPL